MSKIKNFFAKIGSGIVMVYCYTCLAIMGVLSVALFTVPALISLGIEGIQYLIEKKKGTNEVDENEFLTDEELIAFFNEEEKERLIAKKVESIQQEQNQTSENRISSKADEVLNEADKIVETYFEQSDVDKTL